MRRTCPNLGGAVCSDECEGVPCVGSVTLSGELPSSGKTLVVARAGIDPKLYTHSMALAVRSRLVREIIHHVGYAVECSTEWMAEVHAPETEPGHALALVAQPWVEGDDLPEGTRLLTCRVFTLLDAVGE